MSHRNPNPPSLQRLSTYLIVAVILLLACLANFMLALVKITEGDVDASKMHFWIGVTTGPTGVLFGILTIRGLSKRL